MLDERLERVKRALDAPPWDDLRSSRVLGRVLEEVNQTRRRRVTGAVAVAGAVVLASAAAAAWWLGVGTAIPATPPQVQASAVAPASPADSAEGSVLTLADGSRAELSAHAAVHALEQSATRVSVRQSRGRVRYEVSKRPEREFLVQAGEVQVRVLGTIFAVDLLEDGVEVSVERGRVSVRDRQRLVELTRGESVILARSPAADSAEPAAPPPQEAPAPPQQDLAAEVESGSRTKTPPRAARVPSADVLLARADEARQRGQLDQAAQALSALVEHHGRDPRAVSAWFTLGRVERARGRNEASAQAFQRCFDRSPAGTLAEDALAEAANAWGAAGRAAQAREAATSYLARYPGGAHAERMRVLSGR